MYVYSLDIYIYIHSFILSRSFVTLDTCCKLTHNFSCVFFLSFVHYRSVAAEFTTISDAETRSTFTKKSQEEEKHSHIPFFEKYGEE